MAYGYGGFRLTPQARKNLIIVITALAGLALFGALDAWLGNKILNLVTIQQLLGAAVFLVTYWIWQGR